MVLMESNPDLDYVAEIDIGHGTMLRDFFIFIPGTTIVMYGSATIEFTDYSNTSSYAVLSVLNPVSDTYSCNWMEGENYYFMAANDLERRNKSDNSLLESLSLLPLLYPYVLYKIPSTTYLIVLYFTET